MEKGNCPLADGAGSLYNITILLVNKTFSYNTSKGMIAVTLFSHCVKIIFENFITELNESVIEQGLDAWDYIRRFIK